MAEKFYFQVQARDYKKRLDDFLFDRFPDLSRMYLRELVRDEKCEVNGEWKNRGYLLKTNDFVEIELDLEGQKSLQAEPIPLDIIFEDGDILVINKPGGMLVHPTVRVREGTLLNAVAHHLNRPAAGGEGEAFKRAGLVHRLDKDTSGLLLISKTPRAHRILSSHFQRKLVEKRYFALVEGEVRPDSGTIDAPIGRYAETRVWNIKPDGKRALTKYSVKRRVGGASLLELEPVTGRTNQLRIHCSLIGHPIIGDEKYGGREYPRLCLHAYRLAFRHPADGKILEFESALPEDMTFGAIAG